MKYLRSTFCSAALLMSSLAYAQTMVVAVTDLNVRGGPGPQYPVIGTISVNGEASLLGCLENSRWCQVSASGVEGWAYSDYLGLGEGETRIIVTERQPDLVPVIAEGEVETTGAGALSGAATGAVAGALIAGPIGAAVGTVAGAATGGFAEGALSDPDPVITDYVIEHEVEPVYLEGEVVVGAAVPDTVVLQEIPDQTYRYAYINGQPVVIEPQSRQIVYVVR